MIARIIAYAKAFATCVRDYFAGLLAGLFVIWFFPRLATGGLGAILVIGTLSIMAH